MSAIRISGFCICSPIKRPSIALRGFANSCINGRIGVWSLHCTAITVSVEIPSDWSTTHARRWGQGIRLNLFVMTSRRMFVASNVQSLSIYKWLVRNARSDTLSRVTIATMEIPCGRRQAEWLTTDNMSLCAAKASSTAIIVKNIAEHNSPKAISCSIWKHANDFSPEPIVRRQNEAIDSCGKSQTLL